MGPAKVPYVSLVSVIGIDIVGVITPTGKKNYHQFFFVRGVITSTMSMPKTGGSAQLTVCPHITRRPHNIFTKVLDNLTSS